MISFLWSIAASLFSKMLAGLFASKTVTADERAEHDNIAAKQIQSAVDRDGGGAAQSDLVRHWTAPE